MVALLVRVLQRVSGYLRWLLAAGVLTLGVVHLDASAQPARPAGLSDDDWYGTVLRASRWEDPKIRVCWENPSPADAQYRAVVQRAVADTWEKASPSIKFWGWEKCDDQLIGIHIKIAEEDAHVEKVGRFLGGRRNGLVMNFIFERWNTRCATTKEACVYALAVHEFGHVLGFTHEQNRTDAPPECRLDSQGIDGDYKVTKYDATSIMNYCKPGWYGDGKLSALDLEAVRKFYP